jgi:putative addiction module component (TIGR02574 family)
MTKALTKDEILEMPVSERLRLIETLWDSIDSNALPVPASHLRALDIALADHERNPNEGSSWEEVRDELFPNGLS